MIGQPTQLQIGKDLQAKVDLKLNPFIKFNKSGQQLKDMEILKIYQAIDAMTEQAFKEQLADGLLRLPTTEQKS